MAPKPPKESSSSKDNKANGHVQDIRSNEKKAFPPKKVYTLRNSVLTDLMEVNHLQTVYNISVAVFSLLLLCAVLYYLSAPKMFVRDIRLMAWGMSNIPFAVAMWLSFNVFAFVIFQGFKLWVRFRNAIHSKLADYLFLALYIVSIVFMFTATPYAVCQVSFRPITNFTIMCEQVRIFMKVHSFVKESVPRALQYKPLKDGKEQEHNLFPTASHFCYFLLVPVLMYRDSYPRKQEPINWSFIFHNVFKFLACIFITYCVFMRFVVDVFQKTGQVQVTLPDATLIFAGAMVVGSMWMFLMFYSILHSWLNIFAELTRFGDREFYQDWWNSTSFSQYYRKWNLVVHDWLYTYVYMEALKMKFNRSVSMIFVFVVSAVVHEYVIALSMGFFYPVLMFTYTTIGMIILFMTKEKTGQFWNTFMFCMLFCGWGCIISMYAVEWFARANCPGTNKSPPTFFEFRSWDASCRIIDYDS